MSEWKKLVESLNNVSDEAFAGFYKYKKTDWPKAQEYYKIVRKTWDLRMKIAKDCLRQIP